MTLVGLLSLRNRRALVGSALLLTACSAACAGPRRPPESANAPGFKDSSPANAPRLKDSVPDKLAAQRAATPGLEAEDARWGFSAARERKRKRDDDQEAARMKAASTTDIRATPTDEVAPVFPKP